MGRMGRDHQLTPNGFGSIILKEAMRQSLEWGSFFALELHAKNEKLVQYYEQFGFIKINNDKHHMIIPYRTLKRAVGIRECILGLTGSKASKAL